MNQSNQSTYCTYIHPNRLIHHNRNGNFLYQTIDRTRERRDGHQIRRSSHLGSFKNQYIGLLIQRKMQNNGYSADGIK